MSLDIHSSCGLFMHHLNSSCMKQTTPGPYVTVDWCVSRYPTTDLEHQHSAQTKAQSCDMGPDPAPFFLFTLGDPIQGPDGPPLQQPPNSRTYAASTWCVRRSARFVVLPRSLDAEVRGISPSQAASYWWCPLKLPLLEVPEREMEATWNRSPKNGKRSFCNGLAT